MDSYLPHEGKVVVHNKGARRIALRIPHWVSRRDLRAEASGRPMCSEWVGNHIVFEGIDPAQELIVTFPVKRGSTSYTVNSGTPYGQGYTCTFRGSTLVDISPRDASPTSYPFYERWSMDTDRAPMKTIERFVADKSIVRW